MTGWSNISIKEDKKRQISGNMFLATNSLLT